MINQSLLRQSRYQPKSRAISVPAPVGGWNTRDALADMPEDDAVNLDNWFPTVGKCEVRPGYAEHATGIGSGDVESLFEFHAEGNQKLIACGNGNIYDATSLGAASSLGSGFTEDKWQGVNFSGYIHLVNGADTGQLYDGTTLADMTWTGSGFTLANMDGIQSHKHRLYLWDTSTQDFWYGGVDGITGTMTKFPLSRVTQLGGNLIAMVSWSLDNGAGIDDLAAFVMSSGQIVVYSGADPGDAADWSLVGVFNIGEPMNKRGFVSTAGDAVITTTSDYVSMSEVLRDGQIGTASKLSGAVMDASANKSLDGWQSVLWKRGHMIVFNVPNSDATYDQHVINTITGAATRFKDIPARCWSVFDTDLYFGSGDGNVYKITGADDGGTDIQANAEQAWNDFNTPQTKRLCAHRPILETQGDISYEIGTGFDFRRALTPAATATVGSGSEWDAAEWDVAPWSAENQVDVNWRIAAGVGQNLSTRLRVSAQQAIAWLRTDYRIEVGTNL